MMFSKAKRFPEGRKTSAFQLYVPTELVLLPPPPPVYFSVGKDYIPGPGEYDLPIDDTGRHKRYGFLTQTNRFPEGTDTSESPTEFYSTTLQNTSSTTMTSVSSSGTTRVSSESSNKSTCSDEMMTSTSSFRLSPKRRSSASLESTTSTNAQFDKARYTMQREIDALQSKLQKMETMAATLEANKNDAKALLISRDLEMADLRSKNAILQKTITRQEKASKTAQFTKKIEQYEEQLISLKDSHEKVLNEKNVSMQQLQNQLERSNSLIEELKLSQQEKLQAVEVQCNLFSAQLSESKREGAQYKSQLDILHKKLSDAEDCCKALTHDLETNKLEAIELKSMNNELMVRLHAYQESNAQLESQLGAVKHQVETFEKTVNEQEQQIKEKTTLATNIQQQFEAYRCWIDDTVIPHLRAQRTLNKKEYFAELSLLLSELNEAKKFINRQAQYINELKSDTHWLQLQNQQLNTIAESTINDLKELSQLQTKKKGSLSTIFKPKKQEKQQKQEIPRQDELDSSDTATVSYSSGSICSNDDINRVILNDSGFGLLVDDDLNEEKN